MAFSYEKQGASTFLTYRLAENEALDQDAYGMLKNNAVPHILSPTYSQLDEVRELRFDVSGLRIARDYFAQRMFTRQQIIAMLLGVADGFAATGEYMLEERMIACSLDCLYLDDRLDISMVCVPVIGFSGGAGARGFLSEVLANLKQDGSSDTGYLTQIRTSLADTSGFSVSAFQKLLGSLTLKPSSSVTSGSAGLSKSAGLSNSAGLGSGGLGSAGLSTSGLGSGISGGLGSVPSSSGSLSGSSYGDSSSFSANAAAPASFGGIAIPPPSGSAGLSGTGDPGRLWPSVSGSLQDGSTQKKEKKGFFGHKDANKDSKKAIQHKESKQSRFSFKFKKKHVSDEVSENPSVDSRVPRIAGMPFAIPGEDSSPVVAEPPATKPEYQRQPSAAPVVQNDLGYGITEVYGIPNLADRQATSGSLGSGKAPVTTSAYLKRIETGELKSIDVTPFRIGRRRVEVDFHIADKLRVSRVHAIITYESGSFFISDNASVNHTAVNGVQVKPFEKTALAHGDRISLGDEELLFLLG